MMIRLILALVLFAFPATRPAIGDQILLVKEAPMTDHAAKSAGPTPSDYFRKAKEDFTKRLREIGQLQCQQDPKIQRCLKFLRLNPAHPAALRELDARLAQIREGQILNPDVLAIPPPEEVFSQGELCLGTLVDGPAYTQTLAALPLGVGIVAPIGKGKTTTLARLVYEMGQAGANQMLILARKSELAGLATLPLPPLDLVVHARQLRIALWEPPPGAEKFTSMNSVLNILASYLGMELSQDVVLRPVRHLLCKFEQSYRGSRWPSVVDTLRIVQAYKPRSKSEESYKQTALTCFNLLKEYTDPIFNASRGNLAGILGKRVLIVADDLPEPSIYQTIAAYIYNYCHQWNLAQGRGDGRFHQALVFDDSQLLAHRQSPRGSHHRVLPFNALVLNARSTGIAPILAFQGASEADPTLLAQLGTLIVPGSITSASEVRVLGDALGLHDKDAWVLQKGIIGQAIVRQSMSEYPAPVRIQVVPVEFDRNIPAERWEQEMAPRLAALPWSPLVNPGDSAPTAAPPSNILSESAFRLLLAVIAEPEQKATRYYAAAGLDSGRQAAKAKAELLARGYLREHSLAGQKFFEVTQAGYSRAGVAPPHSRTRGGFLHRLVIHRIQAHLVQLGYQVLGAEYALPNGKVSDLVARDSAPGGPLIAVEVASGKSDEVKNILSALAVGGADRVWSVVFKQFVARKIKQELAGQCDPALLGRVEFRLAGEFL